MMKRRALIGATIAGRTGIVAVLAACALPGGASAFGPGGPPVSPGVTFQSGSFSQDGLYDAHSGWVSGLSSTFWQFTMGAQGGVGPGPCLLGYTLDGVPQPGWASPSSPCNPNTATYPVNLADLTDGTHQITGSALINSGLPPQSQYDPPQWYTVSGSFSFNVDNTVPAVSVAQPQTAWRAGTTTVPVSGTTTGPSGIAGLICGGQTYSGSTAQLGFASTGEHRGNCTAYSGAGVSSAPVPYDVLVDNTPPTGYFALSNLNTPTQVAVDVADAESGVAGGQIAIQTAGGWQNLPTNYNAASGQLAATIPDDGSIPDGPHVLQAVVWSAVGNQATVTTNVNGAHEEVSLPLRNVTQMHVGRSTVLTKRCTLKRVRLRSVTRKIRDQRPRARLIRRCVTVGVPHSTGPLKLSYGQAGSVGGLVQTADGEPIAGARVNVSEQAPGWTAQPAGTISSDSQGRFSYRIAAGPSRTITFSFPGTDTLRSAAASTSVSVSDKATIKAGKTVRVGVPLRLYGRLLGGFIPPGGTLIQLQYRVLGYPEGWVPFDGLVRTQRNGKWVKTIKMPRNAAGFTYAMRGRTWAQNGWPYSGAFTNVLTRHVLR
jgi:hypothetical protein